jgi:hypothetical protein
MGEPDDVCELSGSWNSSVPAQQILAKVLLSPLVAGRLDLHLSSVAHSSLSCAAAVYYYGGEA